MAESIRKDIEDNKEKKDVVILALGTKSDLKDSRQVELVQAMNWAASKKIRVVEVTASDRSETVLQVFFWSKFMFSFCCRHSLYEPFMYLASKLNPPPNKSTLAQLTSTIKRDKNREAD